VSLFKSVCVALLTGLCFHFGANAQPDKPDKPTFDTLYICTFPDRLAIRFVREVQLVGIGYQQRGLDQLLFHSNSPANTGFGIDYKWLSLEYTRSLPWTKEDPLKGKSKMRGFGLATSTRKIWFKAFYRQNEGFYLSNTDDILPQYRQSKDYPYYQRPDILTSTFFSTINYCFNHRRFSNSSNLYQLEQQRKSAGSFVSGLSLVRNNYTSDSALVPLASPQRGSDFKQTIGLEVLSLGANIGYIHNFSFGKRRCMFFNVGFIPGMAYQSSNRKWETGQESNYETFGLNAELRISLGYNHPRWFSSFGFRYFSVFNEADKSNPISIFYSSGTFNVGYRLAVPENRPAIFKKTGL